MYVKLFASLYQGTLRGRSDAILVFTNLLAHADQYGTVDKHPKAIAEETGLSLEAVETAIQHLEEPDPESRSPEMDGRRIVRMDEHRAWGWKIINYGKYRAIRSEEDRREQNRLAQERYRQKHKPPSAIVSRGKPPSAKEEVEVEVKKQSIVGINPDPAPQNTENPASRTKQLRADAVQALAFLNEKTGRRYEPVAANIDPIVSRLKQGSSIQDIRMVIAKKCRDWGNNDKMSIYLRPKTLFNATNFANYKGELGAE